MKVSTATEPKVGKRGATAIRGDFKVTSEDGQTEIHVMVDCPRGKTWSAEHTALYKQFLARFPERDRPVKAYQI